MQTMTGFELAALASEKLGRTIRPQMVYNYMKKGRIASVDVNGKQRISLEAAAQFINEQSNGVSVDKKARRAELSTALDELL